MVPTIYKRPHIYKSNVYKRYGMNRGGLGVYKLPYGSPQGWTNTNVPAGVQTLHDFGDGLGAVPAIPYEDAAISNSVVRIKPNISKFATDDFGISNTVVRIKPNISKFATDDFGISNTVVNIIFNV